MYHGIRRRLDGQEYLTWAEVRDLHSRRICIGSHTVTHPELRHLREPEINRELGESKRTIEDKLGCAIRSFSYFYAFPETGANKLHLGRPEQMAGAATVEG